MAVHSESKGLLLATIAAVGLAAAAQGARASTPLVIAGGGGGSGFRGYTTGDGGQTGTSGSTPYSLIGGRGTGGTGGNGGMGGTEVSSYIVTCCDAGGGAGWLTAGTDGVDNPGSGGQTGPSFAGGNGGGYGGYGGGGAAGAGGGGGGGYSGGGGGNFGTVEIYPSGGGGGGSYTAPSLTLVSAEGNANPGNGFVTINGSVNFGYTGSMQDYTVPTSGVYDILVAGAQGGVPSGEDIPGVSAGAEIEASGYFTAGTVLDIVVGEQGGYDWYGGGGGGSFVFENVPEPASWALMLVGIGILGVSLRCGKKAAPERS